MAKPIIEVKNLSKLYRLGALGATSFREEAELFWNRISNFGKTRKNGNGVSPLNPQPSTPNTKARTEREFWALRDVSFDVQPGEVVGIIGRNGAGKSTLFKILSRITEPTSGEVIMRGRVASLLEVGTGFHPELSGRDNIYLNGAILGMKKVEITQKYDEIVDFAEVEGFIDTPVKRYSSGMYVRLAFAVAAHLDPEILIVDEVLAVGDAAFQKKCVGKMNYVSREQGRTVLFVSHNTSAIENLCHRVVLLANGKTMYQGDKSKAITKYLTETSIATNVPLKNRGDRSGNGLIRLTEFAVETVDCEPLSVLRSGQDIVFAFGYEAAASDVVSNVDIGFSFDTDQQECLFALYSSYVREPFRKVPNKGIFRCIVRRLPVAPGQYRLSARITVNGEEADFPFGGIASIEVEPGDFYGSGKRGFLGKTFLMVDGTWTLAAE